MEANKPKGTDAKIREAGAARNELRAALAAVGLVLPSLGIDLPSMTSDCLPPLVELGRCRADVARQLAAALRKSAQ
ncbi:hypothetical protein [Streptomyces montanisoli]|uniref:Uncharacterized protein n=1 Tax=Streptomyces montanisoli TaxID=2798581 RepID=A0A940RVZ4_9ACTN|nr:hypothetical protein [Streptomyces montanisoli]MBP0458751.1 hypothetical protein [Streptomyces montanisoli]